MTIEVKVPTLPESVADALVLAWHKKPGDAVSRDEILVDIETDKVVLEVPSPADGTLDKIVADDGTTVVAGEILAMVSEGGAGQAAAKTNAKPAAKAESKADKDGEPAMGPAVRKLLTEHGLEASQVHGSGKDGRITKEDVLAAVAGNKSASPKNEPAKPGKTSAPAPSSAGSISFDPGERTEKRVPMTRLRARIAERLLHAAQSTAMLTTFNEVNMQPIMDMRTQYKDAFEKKHGVKLGFMSLFVKASAEALRRFPEVNASLDGDDLVYHGFVDIGVAVSSERGLVVPILRNAEHMSLSEIELGVLDFGKRARDGKLGLEEMTGGTFTISNGGVFGSLMSTPILNPPQSAILGMHTIQQRPIAEQGQVVIRPMMYIALSYDHRVIDGKSAVSFLKTIKELVEDPQRILLDV